MRDIELIVIHCSATRPNALVDADVIRSWHKQKGWSDIGYHFVVLPHGGVERGRPLRRAGAHVRGYNGRSIGICYVGGLDDLGRPNDTRTDCQKEALIEVIQHLKFVWPNARVVGHRDLSPDTNGDGKIESHEWLKECPCFNAKEEYQNL